MKHVSRISLIMLLALMLAATTLMATGCSKEEPAEEPAVEEPAEEPTEEPAEEPAVAEGEEVLEGACTSCHDVTRIYLQTEMTDWNNVIATMETAHGAVLTDEEKTQIAAFLESRNPSEGETVIQGKCTTCHDVSKIFSQPSGTNWEGVLDTMIDVHGAVLTEEEQAAVLGYLENR
ncbi:MAG: hypothetical protein AAGU73_00170 [Actinomycetota bacterium]